MCGIVAIHDPGAEAAARRSLARVMTGKMGHRGPDSQGFYDQGPVSLGMCRLSITDVAGGMQPLFSEDRRIALVCNGEIYNHQALRRELACRGHVFRTGSDCEVMVHLYEEKGEAFVQELCGMFAFALWDERRGSLFCARDRTGMKPLYYFQDQGRTVLASELTGLTHGLGLRPDLDVERVLEILLFGFPVHESETVDRAIKRLAPASAMRIAGGECEIWRYWRPAYLDGDGRLGGDQAASAPPEDCGELRQVMLTALGEHLVSEVPSAIMLSGGLDSTALAVFAHGLGFAMTAVSASYAGDHDCDESGEARQTAERLGFDFRRVLLDPDRGLAAFDELTRHCDEPVADIASVPQWEIFKALRELGVTVVHSGLGGDEVFYGYGMWNDLGAEVMRGGRDFGLAPGRGSGFLRHPGFAAAYREMAAGLRPEASVLLGELDDRLAARLALNSLGGPDRIYHLLFATWLPGNCLHLGDRLSMAHSLELRLPLLDDRLVAHVQGLPQRERFDPANAKPLLKRLLAGVLTEEIINRPKRGFTPPAQLMREIVAACRDQALSGWASRNLFVPGRLERCHAAYAAPDFLFHLAVFEKWLEHAYPRS
jgi:asparagine synthase (glutamine-hydrolysing)